MSKETIKGHVVNYSKNRYYFHINDLKRYFKEKEIKFEEDTFFIYFYF